MNTTTKQRKRGKKRIDKSQKAGDVLMENCLYLKSVASKRLQYINPDIKGQGTEHRTLGSA